MPHPALEHRVARSMPVLLEHLAGMVRIPSVSLGVPDREALHRSAQAAAALLEHAGAQRVDVVTGNAAAPAVIAHVPGPSGAPTVLLYAHHDVQPAGPPGAWTSPPFEPALRDGRMYGRGTADDKGGVLIHAAALLAHEGRPPVGVTVLIEGEEECGSPNVEPFLRRHRDALRADVAIVADGLNGRGHPTLTTSLRGLVDCVVEVRTLERAVHSGEAGGALPDALSALARLLASLHTPTGEVAVPGLVEGDDDETALDEDEFRRDHGALPGVASLGRGSLARRLWHAPAVSIVGVDAPAISEASSQLVPSARAKVSLRIAPGQDPDDAMDALREHLERHAPWGARVDVLPGVAEAAWQATRAGTGLEAARGALADAWGVAPELMGNGGSIPILTALQRALPSMDVLITGVGDPHSNAHSVDESVTVADLHRAAVAEALLLERLAAPAGG